jgi:hypothetical protein
LTGGFAVHGAIQMRIFVGLVMLASFAALAYIFAAQPSSMRVSRDGVPHFTPPTIHPETGETIAIDRLIRHFKGVKP